MRPSTARKPTGLIPLHPLRPVTAIQPVAMIQAGRDRRGGRQTTDLAADITEHGLGGTIGVVEESSNYRVLHGDRRFATVKRLGWIEVPAQVLVGPDQALRALSGPER
jgi:ParB-like chromosome segregation protein Spo0J